MSIEQMRAEVANLYAGQAWKQRVMRMSDAQILAIYNRQVRDRKVNK